MSENVFNGLLVDQPSRTEFGSKLVREYMTESSLMMVKILFSVIFAFYIHNNIAFLQNFRISRSSHWGVFEGGCQSEEKDCERFVCME
jgi:hypothetical protein